MRTMYNTVQKKNFMIENFYVAFEGFTYGVDKIFTKEVLESIFEMISDASVDISWFYDQKKDSFVIIDGFNNEFEVIDGFEVIHDGVTYWGYRICMDWSWEELEVKDKKCKVIKISSEKN